MKPGKDAHCIQQERRSEAHQAETHRSFHLRDPISNTLHLTSIDSYQAFTKLLPKENVHLLVYILTVKIVDTENIQPQGKNSFLVIKCQNDQHNLCMTFF